MRVFLEANRFYVVMMAFRALRDAEANNVEVDAATLAILADNHFFITMMAFRALRSAEANNVEVDAAKKAIRLPEVISGLQRSLDRLMTTSPFYGTKEECDALQRRELLHHVVSVACESFLLRIVKSEPLPPPPSSTLHCRGRDRPLGGIR